MLIDRVETGACPQAYGQRRRERIPSADGIRNLDGKTGAGGLLLWRLQNGALWAAGQRDQLQRKTVQQLPQLHGGCSTKPEHPGEHRQFLRVEFQHVGPAQAALNPGTVVKRLPQIQVEDASAPGLGRGQKTADGSTGNRGTLGQRTKSDNVRGGGQFFQAWRKGNKVPRHVFMDAVSRYALTVQLNRDGARGMPRVHGDEFTIQGQGVKSAQYFPARLVVADGADHGGLSPQGVRMISEVRRGAAQLSSVGQQVPENFTEADDDGAVRRWTHGADSLASRPL